MKIVIRPGLEIYQDGYLNSNLGRAKEIIKADWDMIFAVDGGEGAGKSVLAQQCAAFCDPSLNIDRICFTPQEFRKAVLTANKYQAIVYDEAYGGLSSRATMSLINRTLVGLLTEIRERNLFIFIVMPCYFDLDKYVALWRSRALIHVYTGEDFERGYFAFYNTDRKKDLYIMGKKFYSYANPKPNFIGRFTNTYTVDEAEYRKKKRQSNLAKAKKEEDEAKRREIENELFIRLQDDKLKLSHNIKMRIMSMASSTYFRKLKQHNEMEELS